MPFVTTWLDLEGIMISEINQAETDKYHMISLICGFLKKKKKQTNKMKTKQKNKAKLIDTENRLEVARGNGWGVGEMDEGSQWYKVPVIK